MSNRAVEMHRRLDAIENSVARVGARLLMSLALLPVGVVVSCSLVGFAVVMPLLAAVLPWWRDAVSEVEDEA